MIRQNLTFRAADGMEIYVYRWLPETGLKAAMIISHGMAETAGRYEELAAALTKCGFAVYAADQRGHGQTIKDPGYSLPAAASGNTLNNVLNMMLDDIHRLAGIVREEIPARPLFLLGHSMGSFLVQRYLIRWGGELKGAILSGAAGPANLLTLAGQLIARLEILRIGGKGISKILYKLSFGGFNKQFQPARTDFDWLSRDNAEVDRYIADPFCGAFFPAAFFYDLFSFWRQIHRPAELRKIPGNLPLYFFPAQETLWVTMVAASVN